MMRAFGSGGWLGPIIALSHKCSATARGHSILYDLAVLEKGLERTVVQAHRQTRKSGRLKKTRVCSDLWVGGRLVIWEGQFHLKGSQQIPRHFFPERHEV